MTRSSSFYVEIPDGITVQFLSSGVGGELVWTEAFNFCRKTGEESLRSAVQDMQLHELPTPLPPMPEIRPGHHSFFSSQPTAGSWPEKQSCSYPRSGNPPIKRGRCERGAPSVTRGGGRFVFELNSD